MLKYWVGLMQTKMTEKAEKGEKFDMLKVQNQTMDSVNRDLADISPDV